MVRKLSHFLLTALLAALFASAATLPARAQDEARRTTSKVAPRYPELAKRAKVTGTVKLELTISAAGAVKNVRIIGGHPLLVEAATEAVKKWRYAPAPEETVTVVQFNFDDTVS